MMDHFGVDRAVLMGSSMGVDTAFELALRQPERVTGIFAVAGVPATPSPPCWARSGCHTRWPAGSPSASPRRSERRAVISPVTTRLPVVAAPSPPSPTPASCCRP